MTLIEEGASYVNEHSMACGGTLTLTTTQLMFESTGGLTKCYSLSFPLSEISEVTWFKTLSIIPNGFSLMLSNGDIQSFIVLDKKRWKDLIDQAKENRPVVSL